LLMSRGEVSKSMTGGWTSLKDGGSNDFSHDSAADGLMTSATHAVHGYAGSPYALNAEHLGGKLPTDSTASAGSRTSTSDSNGKALVSPCSTADLDALEELEELEASVEAVSKEVEEWRPSSFEFQRTLQMAGRNQGAVNLMKCLETGKFVAVKAMPQSWTTLGHQEHRRAHPRDTENPWMDLGLVRYLSKKGVPFICDPLGIFMDSSWTYCVSSLATEGDFFCFVSQGKDPGPEREKELQPFIVQIFSALRWLHERYIAHCDISMENILVTKESDGRYQVKLIDFSMAVPGQRVTCGHRGKPSYQAPEMALSAFYDSFALDCFALGVVLFSSAARIYPWMSTVQGRCKCFDYVLEHGHRKFWRTRKIKKTPPVQSINDVLSEELKQILEGLLAFSPSDRFSLEEVFSYGWFQGSGVVLETSFGTHSG